MRKSIATVSLGTLILAANAPAAPRAFNFAGDIFQTNSASEWSFRLGTEVSGNFEVNPTSADSDGVYTFESMTGRIYGDGIYNHLLFTGFVRASDNHSLIEPGQSIDEVIIILANALEDRPVDQGGHGLHFDDPRGDIISRFGGIGVRLRLIGPTSWFDAAAGPESILAALPRYEATESWLEFDDYAIETRAYADFRLTHFAPISEPSSLMLAAISTVIGARCRKGYRKNHCVI